MPPDEEDEENIADPQNEPADIAMGSLPDKKPKKKKKKKKDKKRLKVAQLLEEDDLGDIGEDAADGENLDDLDIDNIIQDTKSKLDASETGSNIGNFRRNPQFGRTGF
jgi:hypothetical protein